jgi:hypothetical protein
VESSANFAALLNSGANTGVQAESADGGGSTVRCLTFMKIMLEPDDWLRVLLAFPSTEV